MFTIFQYMICCYSTIIKAFEQAQKEVFQYIPCYYLTFPVENPLINLLEFQYISCCYSTNTILFNFIKSRPFQYIICCYSTINKASLPRTFPNFNTSYVIIQHNYATIMLYRKEYFNTSHVVIQQARIEESLTQFCQFQYITCYYSTHHEECVLHFHTYFNTSHVIIQPKSVIISATLSKISIHSMLLFNQRKTVILVSY